MVKSTAPNISSDPRLGFHYFPDTLHYRDADLQTWLPVLQDLGASWLVLRSELGRAIPERFLRGLKQAKIEPLIQFDLPLERMPELKEIATLLNVYARWGARYVIFFDRPNASSAWPPAGWVQQELVERFLDRYLPVANLALQVGLTPVFPPLEPGGSYWDTAFLRSALEAMQRRKQEPLLQSLVLSAYAWSAPTQSLNWGAGGPERWPQSRPYQTPPGSQDQHGLRIFDWYEAVVQSVLHEACPVILLQAGLPGDPASMGAEAPAADETTYTSIARLLAGEEVVDALNKETMLEPIPSKVIACAFAPLSAAPGSPLYAHAWFQEDGKTHPAVEAIRAWRRACQALPEQQKNGREKSANSGPVMLEMPIQHYLLLPGFEWGVSDWYLEVIRPFVKKYRPTIGFSPEEAERSTRVTIVGNAHSFPEDLVARLQKAGCYVEQISGDGTFIATQLAER